MITKYKITLTPKGKVKCRKISKFLINLFNPEGVSCEDLYQSFWDDKGVVTKDVSKVDKFIDVCLKFPEDVWVTVFFDDGTDIRYTAKGFIQLNKDYKEEDNPSEVKEHVCNLKNALDWYNSLTKENKEFADLIVTTFAAMKNEKTESTKGGE